MGFFEKSSRLVIPTHLLLIGESEGNWFNETKASREFRIPTNEQEMELGLGQDEYWARLKAMAVVWMGSVEVPFYMYSDSHTYDKSREIAKAPVVKEVFIELGRYTIKTGTRQIGEIDLLPKEPNPADSSGVVGPLQANLAA